MTESMDALDLYPSLSIANRGQCRRMCVAVRTEGGDDDVYPNKQEERRPPVTGWNSVWLGETLKLHELQARVKRLHQSF